MGFNLFAGAGDVAPDGGAAFAADPAFLAVVELADHAAFVEGQGDVADGVFGEPGVGLSGKNDAGREGGAGDGEAVVRGRGAAQAPAGAGDVAGLEQVAVDETGLGGAAGGAGGGVEQPAGELHLRRLRAGGIDAELTPQFGDGAPVAEQPAAVLVGAVALGLPLRAGREQAGVAGHVELSGVADAPTARPVVTEQHRVGVDFFKDVEVALRLDFEDGAAARAEAGDPGARVAGGELLGALPIVEVAAHERGANRLGRASLLHDHGVELEAPIYRKNAVAVLDPEQPLPPAIFK